MNAYRSRLFQLLLATQVFMLAFPSTADARKRRAAQPVEEAPAAAPEPAPAPEPAAAPAPAPSSYESAPPPVAAEPAQPAASAPASRVGAGPFGTATTANRLQLLGGLRFGTDDLNLGLGIRAGYTLPMNLYLGGTFEYYLGSSTEVPGMKVSASVIALAFEGGYDFQVLPQLVVRPIAGVGPGMARGEVCTSILGPETCSSSSSTKVLFAFGGMANYLMGDLLLGGDVRMLIVDDFTSFVMGAHAGMMF